jgi:hypothetical protein
MYYADRVRELHICDSDREDILDSSAFAEFARGRPVLNPFRQLLRLHVDPTHYSIGTKYVVLFLHNGLEELEISECWPEWDIENNQRLVYQLLNDIASRAIGLKKLQLHVHAFGRELEGTIIKALPSLRKLTRLDLSPCLVTPKLVLALSQLPELKEIAIDTHGRDIDTAVNGLCAAIDDPFPDEISQDLSYRSLAMFYTQGRLSHLKSLFCRSGIFPRLTVLSIDVTAESTGSGIYTILGCVAEACPVISCIQFTRVRDGGLPILPSTKQDPISIHSIMPVCKMKALDRLVIDLPYSIQISEADLDGLLTQQGALENLDFLNLGARPLELVQPVMTLRVLITLASIRPKCKRIHLYLQTHMVQECLDDLDRADACVEFAELEYLEISFSPIKDEQLKTSRYS